MQYKSIERSKAMSLLAAWKKQGTSIHALYAYQGNVSFRLLCKIKTVNTRRLNLQVDNAGVASLELRNAQFERVEPSPGLSEYSHGLRVNIPEIKESCYLYKVRDLDVLNAKAKNVGML